MRRAQGFTGGGLATVGLILLAASIDPGRVTDAAALVLLALGVALIGQGARMIHCATRSRRRGVADRDAAEGIRARAASSDEGMAVAEKGAARMEAVLAFLEERGYLPPSSESGSQQSRKKS